MERNLIFAWILILSSATVQTCCHGYYSDSVPYVPSPKKVTHLHFFLHDTLTGENPSAVLVARPNITIFPDNAFMPFGTVLAVDDPLTVGPDITSEVIGNAQGLSVLASQHALSLVVYLDFGFTRGEFNGSSFSVFSRNTITVANRELTVVGGRGKFRLAKGFAELKTYSRSEGGNAVVEYNVTLFHH